jgi:hypothetical protein
MGTRGVSDAASIVRQAHRCARSRTGDAKGKSATLWTDPLEGQGRPRAQRRATRNGERATSRASAARGAKGSGRSGKICSRVARGAVGRRAHQPRATESEHAKRQNRVRYEAVMAATRSWTRGRQLWNEGRGTARAISSRRRAPSSYREVAPRPVRPTVRSAAPRPRDAAVRLERAQGVVRGAC